jgi:hypothetical protein
LNDLKPQTFQSLSEASKAAVTLAKG